eukprot:CAMPEP_0194140458 /NCGR_PEP_ID=MMETSP0152-20130528/10002_1 /TAXON_ID=1049557 /ORGANISM="Thalassiothrix antarctica, Strain L6-D1" /LENGTH=124 /DNA_ID=CAMNT_0038838707 /DNA_START=171 /DNA_END=545 /DNA_ORIENTATION=+
MTPKQYYIGGVILLLLITISVTVEIVLALLIDHPRVCAEGEIGDKNEERCTRKQYWRLGLVPIYMLIFYIVYKNWRDTAIHYNEEGRRITPLTTTTNDIEQQQKEEDLENNYDDDEDDDQTVVR